MRNHVSFPSTIHEKLEHLYWPMKSQCHEKSTHFIHKNNQKYIIKEILTSTHNPLVTSIQCICVEKNMKGTYERIYVVYPDDRTMNEWRWLTSDKKWSRSFFFINVTDRNKVASNVWIINNAVRRYTIK